VTSEKTTAPPGPARSYAAAGGRRLTVRGLTHAFGNVFPMLTGLATAPLTARALGPDGRGEVVVIGAVATLLVLLGSLGFGWVARDAVATDPDSILFWRRLSAWLALASFPPAVTAGFAIAGSFHLSRSQEVAVLGFYAIAAVATRRAVDSGVLVSVGTPHLNSVANLCYGAAVALSVFVLFFLGRLDVTTLVLSNALGFLIQTAVLSYLVHRHIAGRRVELRARLAAMRVDPAYRWTTAGRRGLGYCRAQFLDGLTNRADVLLATFAGGTAVAGLYSVTALLPQIAYTFYVTVVQTTFSRHPRMEANERLGLIFRASSLAACVLSVVGCAAAYPLIPWVFGQEFAAARNYLVPAVCMTVGLAGLSAVLQDLGRRPSTRWLAIVVLLPALTAALLVAWSAAVAVSALGMTFFVVCACYVWSMCGHRGFAYSLGDLHELIP
jgi:O-antigen/teichoic acid export membrane protein